MNIKKLLFTLAFGMFSLIIEDCLPMHIGPHIGPGIVPFEMGNRRISAFCLNNRDFFEESLGMIAPSVVRGEEHLKNQLKDLVNFSKWSRKTLLDLLNPQWAFSGEASRIIAEALLITVGALEEEGFGDWYCAQQYLVIAPLGFEKLFIDDAMNLLNNCSQEVFIKLWHPNLRIAAFQIDATWTIFDYANTACVFADAARALAKNQNVKFNKDKMSDAISRKPIVGALSEKYLLSTKEMISNHAEINEQFKVLWRAFFTPEDGDIIELLSNFVKSMRHR